MEDTYIYQDKIPKIDTDTLKTLSMLKPWRSMLAIVIDWLIIVLCIILCEQISYWFYPLAFVIVGSRFHGLEAMMHEATHYRIHSSKKINEIIGELSIWPMGLSLFLYRKKRHFPHHRNIGTNTDSHIFQTYQKHSERFDLPQPFPHLIKNCLIVAINFPVEIWLGQIFGIARRLPRYSKGLSWMWIGFQILTWLFVVLGSIIISLKIAWVYLLFFVMPLMWIAVFSRYLRLVSEHFGIPASQNDTVIGGQTRTVLVSWPVRVLFWPHNLNYHLEHHWYPSVPFYNLPKLHRLLQQSPDIRERMHITRGVNKLFRELTCV